MSCGGSISDFSEPLFPGNEGAKNTREQNGARTALKEIRTPQRNNGVSSRGEPKCQVPEAEDASPILMPQQVRPHDTEKYLETFQTLYATDPQPNAVLNCFGQYLQVIVDGKETYLRKDMTTVRQENKETWDETTNRLMDDLKEESKPFSLGKITDLNSKGDIDCRHLVTLITETERATEVMFSQLADDGFEGDTKCSVFDALRTAVERFLNVKDVHFETGNYIVNTVKQTCTLLQKLAEYDGGSVDEFTDGELFKDIENQQEKVATEFSNRNYEQVQAAQEVLDSELREGAESFKPVVERLLRNIEQDEEHLRQHTDGIADSSQASKKLADCHNWMGKALEFVCQAVQERVTKEEKIEQLGREKLATFKERFERLEKENRQKSHELCQGQGTSASAGGHHSLQQIMIADLKRQRAIVTEYNKKVQMEVDFEYRRAMVKRAQEWQQELKKESETLSGHITSINTALLDFIAVRVQCDSFITRVLEDRIKFARSQKRLVLSELKKILDKGLENIGTEHRAKAQNQLQKTGAEKEEAEREYDNEALCGAEPSEMMNYKKQLDAATARYERARQKADDSDAMWEEWVRMDVGGVNYEMICAELEERDIRIDIEQEILEKIADRLKRLQVKASDTGRKIAEQLAEIESQRQRMADNALTYGQKS